MVPFFLNFIYTMSNPDGNSSDDDDIVKEIYENLNKTISNVRTDIELACNSLREELMLSFSKDLGSKVAELQKLIRKKDEQLRTEFAEYKEISNNNKNSIATLRDNNSGLRFEFEGLRQDNDQFEKLISGKVSSLRSDIITNDAKLTDLVKSGFEHVKDDLETWKSRCFTLPEQNKATIVEFEEKLGNLCMETQKDTNELFQIADSLSRKITSLEDQLVAVGVRDKSHVDSIKDEMNRMLSTYTNERLKSEAILAGSISKCMKEVTGLSDFCMQKFSNLDSLSKKIAADYDRLQGFYDSGFLAMNEKLAAKIDEIDDQSALVVRNIQDFDARLKNLEQSNSSLINRTKQADREIRNALEEASKQRQLEVPNLAEVVEKAVNDSIDSRGLVNYKKLVNFQTSVRNSISSLSKSLESYTQRTPKFYGPGNK